MKRESEALRLKGWVLVQSHRESRLIVAVVRVVARLQGENQRRCVEVQNVGSAIRMVRACETSHLVCPCATEGPAIARIDRNRLLQIRELVRVCSVGHLVPQEGKLRVLEDSGMTDSVNCHIEELVDRHNG